VTGAAHRVHGVHAGDIMGNVDITLMYFDGCPGWQVAEVNLRSAVAALGRPDVSVRRRPIETVEEAERAGFIGSPTVLLDGRDPFAEPGRQPGLSCRLYVTEQGTANAPSVEQLIEAMC